MSTFRQIQANRRNALKSTGPKTLAGKEQSRCNAVRHGLTAETVIGALEDAEDYKAFEAAITADYEAQSAVEREPPPELHSRWKTDCSCPLPKKKRRLRSWGLRRSSASRESRIRPA